MVTQQSPIEYGSVFPSYLPHIVVELYIVSHLFSSTLYFKDYGNRKSIHNRIKELSGLSHQKIHKILIKEGFEIGQSPSCVHSMIKKMKERERVLSQKTEVEIGKVGIGVYISKT